MNVKIQFRKVRFAVHFFLSKSASKYKERKQKTLQEISKEKNVDRNEVVIAQAFNWIKTY
jgi:hypothetical protein